MHTTTEEKKYLCIQPKREQLFQINIVVTYLCKNLHQSLESF